MHSKDSSSDDGDRNGVLDADVPDDDQDAIVSSSPDGATTGVQSRSVFDAGTSDGIETDTGDAAATNATTTSVSNAGTDTSTSGPSTHDRSDQDSWEQTSEPIGPPDGAYVPCSGAAMPDVVLSPVLTAPKVTLPIDMDMPPGQPNMAYVTERGGALKRFDLSQQNPSATTILEVITSTSGECGFFGVAFHPNFDGDGERRMYVSYMPACPANIFGAGGASTLDAYEVNGDVANKLATVFSWEQPQGNHNGGSVAFGPEGLL